MAKGRRAVALALVFVLAVVALNVGAFSISFGPEGMRPSAAGPIVGWAALAVTVVFAAGLFAIVRRPGRGRLLVPVLLIGGITAFSLGLAGAVEAAARCSAGYSEQVLLYRHTCSVTGSARPGHWQAGTVGVVLICLALILPVAAWIRWAWADERVGSRVGR